MRRRRRRWWRWLLLTGLLAVAAVLAAGWLMFQHIPSWYHPAAIAPADQQRVRDDLAGTQDRLSESLIHEKGPFEHRFTQDQINVWLAIREAIWPLSRTWLPPSLSEPFVAIEENGVRIAATYSRGGLKTVLSARLAVSANTDGLSVQLLEVAGGSLGVPESWVRDELAALDGHAWPAGKRARAQHGDSRLPELGRLFDGVVFPNAWVWWSNDQPFRITGLRFEPGALVVTFEPLPRQGARQ